MYVSYIRIDIIISYVSNIFLLMEVLIFCLSADI